MAETPSKRTPAKAAPAPATASADETPTGTTPAPGENTPDTPDSKEQDPTVGHRTEDGVVSSAVIPGEDLEAATAVVKEATEADPSAHQVAGQSFYNAATTGSGTILPDGTYGDPLPDPQVQRVAQDGDAQLK